MNKEKNKKEPEKHKNKNFIYKKPIILSGYNKLISGGKIMLQENNCAKISVLQ